MEQDDRLLNAMFEMCNHKNPLNDGQREWHIADIPGLLREERYDELDERYNQALTESFTSREAEKRYFFAWNQMDNPFYDMDTLVEAGPQGLALIKKLAARSSPLHSRLACRGAILESPCVAVSQLWLGERNHPSDVDLRRRLQRTDGHRRAQCYRL